MFIKKLPLLFKVFTIFSFTIFIAGCGITDSDSNDSDQSSGTDDNSSNTQSSPEPEVFRIGNAVAPISYWMSAWTLNDLVKTAGFEVEETQEFRPSRMWIPVFQGIWDTDGMFQIPLDSNGWPTSLTLQDGRTAESLVTIVMNSDLPNVNQTGTYQLTYEGEGRLEIQGANILSESEGQMQVEYLGSDGVFINILETDPSGSGDYLKNISMTRPDAVTGERFSRTYLDFIRPFSVIRPMHMAGESIYSSSIDWNDRNLVSDSHWGSDGAPWEVIVDLANQSQSDLWINVPIAASDSYVRNLAQLILDTLDSTRALYFELGNELWNFSLPYVNGREYASAQAQLRWPNIMGQITSYSDSDPVSETMMVHSWQGTRTVEIKTIFDQVWGTQASRIVSVLSGQIGSSVPGWNNNRFILESPVYVGEENTTPPGQMVDAFAVAPYVGDPYQIEDEESPDGFDRSSPEAFIAEAVNYLNGVDRFNETAEEPGLRYLIRSDKILADEFGLPLIAYEGGHHFIGSSLTRDQVVPHPDMYQLYRDYFDMWQEEGGGLFVHFHGIFPRGANEPGQEPGYFESEHFGIKEFQTQPEDQAHRYRAIMDEIRELDSSN